MSTKKLSAILIILVVIAIVLSIGKFGMSGNTANSVDSLDKDEDKELNIEEKSVSVSPVSFFSSQSSPLEVIGTVRSVNEARLYTERSGTVSYVSKTVGNRVSRNEVIAETENQTERAALLQAQGVLEQARATRDKILKGSSDDQLEVLRLSMVSADSSYREARTNVVNTIKSAYTASDDSIRAKADLLFSNPNTNPKLNFTPSDTSLADSVENDRSDIESTLVAWFNESTSLNSDSDLYEEIALVETRLSEIRSFLSDLAYLVNQLQPNVNTTSQTIEGWKASLSVARSSINQSISGLSSVKDLLTLKETAYLVSKSQYEEALGGGRSEDVRVAEASVKQAEGAYNLALSNLEKTIIRSSITGEIASIDIKQGDFVQAFQPVVLVIGSGSGYEIETYITESNKDQITRGSEVLVDGKYKGEVKSVASALDPNNKKIKVLVSFDSTTTKLVNGETVVLSISRSSIVNNGQLLVPISALKIGNESSYVFAVNENDELYEIPVKEGAIIGEKILINEGLNASDVIVVDARGLKEGDRVTLN